MTSLCAFDAPAQPIDHLVRRGAAGDEALRVGGASWSYAQIDRAVGRLAEWLMQEVTEPGARIASWTAKNAAAAILPLATARAGLVHVPINPLLKAAQVEHILADSGAAMLLTMASRAASLGHAATARVVDLASIDTFLAAEDERAGLDPSSAAPDALAAILYTSGSTGRPKGVMLSHANLWMGAESVASYLRLAADDRILALLPLSFDYGQNQLFSSWYAGAMVAPLDYLVARDVVRAVERMGITTLAGVPPLWIQLLESEWPEAVGGQLRRVTNSGGALTPALIERMRAAFPAADIYPMYGLTEAFRSTYLPPELVAAHPTSMGRAIPHAEILVCRPDGSITADDEAGELVHCGPLVAQGYWRDAARTAERFRSAPAASRYGGTAVWSGDTVRRDSEGLLTFVGRDDAMIKVSGYRISPNEIEDAAIASGLADEAVAFGVPDARTGAAIVLLVRAAGKQAHADREAALAAALRQMLPNFMQPATIEWRDALPRNPNGKLDRVALAAEWKAQTDRPAETAAP